jgi:hypothetical protein
MGHWWNDTDRDQQRKRQNSNHATKELKPK